MHLKAQKTFYVKFIFGTFWFGLGKALRTVFMAAWEANGTLSFGYRKVGSVALNCTANQWQGQKNEARSTDYMFCSLDPMPASQCCKRRLSLRQTQRGREQEKSKIKNSGKEIAERKTLHTTLKKLFVTWKQQQFSQAKPVETNLSLVQH